MSERRFTRLKATLSETAAKTRESVSRELRQSMSHIQEASPDVIDANYEKFVRNWDNEVKKNPSLSSALSQISEQIEQKQQQLEINEEAIQPGESPTKVAINKVVNVFKIEPNDIQVCFWQFSISIFNFGSIIDFRR